MSLIQIIKKQVLLINSGLDYETVKNTLAVSPQAGVLVDDAGNEVFRIATTEGEGSFSNDFLAIPETGTIVVVKKAPYTTEDAKKEYAKGIIASKVVIDQIKKATRSMGASLRGTVEVISLPASESAEEVPTPAQPDEGGNE